MLWLELTPQIHQTRLHATGVPRLVVFSQELFVRLDRILARGVEVRDTNDRGVCVLDMTAGGELLEVLLIGDDTVRACCESVGEIL